MKTSVSILISLFAGLFLCSYSAAATYDLSGSWQCTYTGAWASGDTGCAVGPNPSSACTLEQSGDTFTLTLHTTCDPAFTCIFSGTVAGAAYSGSNSGPLDGGGTVENTIQFTASSMLNAAGSGTSQATFPGWVCSWGFTSVILSRGSIPEKYSLTVNTTGSGTVTLDPDGGLYNAGTTVTLTAVPETGWQFDSWSGDAVGSQNPHDILMDGDKTVSATFTRSGGKSAGMLHLILED